MRYYNLTLASASTGKTTRQWGTMPGGRYDPAALEIEFDVYTADYAVPLGASSIKLFGISQQDITQANNFNQATLSLYAGMSKGLPLANATQQGLLLQGTVQQAFGNAIGLNRTLDFVVTSLASNAKNPANIVFNWKANTPLKQAIATSLTNAFPKYKQNLQISANRVLAHDENHYSSGISDFAYMLEHITTKQLGATDTGVRVTVQQNTFNVYDQQTAPNKPVQLNFADLVGQPTWYAPGFVQITVVMRGDLQVGGYVKLPQGFVPGPGSLQTTADARPTQQAGNATAFQGSFLIKQIRHIGALRGLSPLSWVTVLNTSFTASGTGNGQ